MVNKEIKITVPALARVEGEGALDLHIHDNEVKELKLRIYEPPRFFEKFLEGRSYEQVPDIVARICGICPVAYQMSAVNALEAAFELTPSQWIRDMRRVFYCGEWIQSHSLHIHLLAAPDFFGFNDVTQMAEQYPDEVRRGLSLQSIGNSIIRLFGARSVHPVGACVGGFYHSPDHRQVEDLVAKIEQAIPEAEALVRWTAAIDLPEEQQDFITVSLRHEHEYPMTHGRLVSSNGLDISIEEFDQYFKEHQVPHSTALYCLLQGKPYLVGPLARLNHNLDRLPDRVLSLLGETPVSFPSKNMFHSVVARAVEILQCLLEAHRILSNYEETDQSHLEVHPKEGVGIGCTEAPRGMLWHRYALDQQGNVQSATIVPPTSQNQARIEEDLHFSLRQFGLNQPDQAIRLRAEKVVRNYDPCISCSTHFLTLTTHREPDAKVGPASTVADQRIGGGKILVLGIGSPQEDDQIAWALLDRVGKDQRFTDLPSVQYKKLDRPGLALLDSLEGYDCVILIDGIRESDAIEPVVIGSWKDADIQDSIRYSTHEAGVASALQVGERLKKLKSRVMIFGVPVEEKDPSEGKQLKMLVDELYQLLKNGMVVK